MRSIPLGVYHAYVAFSLANRCCDLGIGVNLGVYHAYVAFSLSNIYSYTLSHPFYHLLSDVFLMDRKLHTSIRARSPIGKGLNHHTVLSRVGYHVFIQILKPNLFFILYGYYLLLDLDRNPLLLSGSKRMISDVIPITPIEETRNEMYVMPSSSIKSAPISKVVTVVQNVFQRRMKISAYVTFPASLVLSRSTLKILI